MKLIIFVPPNGNMMRHDFSIHRLGKYFKTKKGIKTIVVKIDNKKLDSEFDNGNYVDEVINVVTQTDLFNMIEKLKPNLILHRSWMLAYPFAARLIKKFDNVVVNIKDWNFSSKKEYKFIFDTDTDFKAIKYIFKNAKYILSHFTKKQSIIWAKKYNVSKNKFIFFPEYCNEDNFQIGNINYDKNNIKLLFAGNISLITSYPEQLFPWKSHLRSIIKVTKQKISIDFIFPSTTYTNIISNKKLCFDWLYENEFNKRINLLKGKTLFLNKENDYDFAFFELETSGTNKKLYEYAVVSKFAFYLELAIPILVNKDFKSISKIVKKYNIGIVFSNDDLNDLNKILNISKKEYNTMIKNIYTFRDTYTYTNNNQVFKKIMDIF